MNWQPIETAPKSTNPDGTLGIIGAWVNGTRWTAKHIWWNDMEEEWNDIFSDYIVYPTHWMPLPEPPEQTK